MADNFDPFALGGGQGDGDAEILALFRQWIGESRIADGIEDEAPDGTRRWTGAMKSSDGSPPVAAGQPGLR